LAEKHNTFIVTDMKKMRNLTAPHWWTSIQASEMGCRFSNKELVKGRL